MLLAVSMWSIHYEHIEAWLDEQDDEAVALVFAKHVENLEAHDD